MRCSERNIADSCKTLETLPYKPRRERGTANAQEARTCGWTSVRIFFSYSCMRNGGYSQFADWKQTEKL